MGHGDVDGRGLQVNVTDKFLDVANVATILECVGGERITQRMRRGGLFDPRNGNRTLHDSLSRRLAEPDEVFRRTTSRSFGGCCSSL